MNTEGSETRFYGVGQRQYTPNPSPRRLLFQKYGVNSEGQPEPNYTTKERMWYAIRRLQDKFARTNDQRCLAKAKELAAKWL